MSTEERVTFTEAGEPVVTVRIYGYYDAFRFAWALAHLQCDFAGVGRRIGMSLSRRLGEKEFRALHKHFTGDEEHAWARDDKAFENTERDRLAWRDRAWKAEAEVERLLGLVAQQEARS